MTVSTLMANEANAGQVGPATMAEGLVWVWCRSVVVPPSSPFVLKAGSMGVFEGGDSMADGVSPDLAVSSYT